MRFPLKFFAVLALLATMPGCAKVADPIPPVTRIPKTTKALTLVQTGKSVRLTFPVTEEDVTGVDLYKHCEPGTGGAQWPKDAEGFRRVELASLTMEGQPPGAYVLQDTIEQTPCRYAIRLINDRKRASDLSNTVSTSPQPVPAPPGNLRAEVRKDKIILTWDPPTTDVSGASPVSVLGYLVNGHVRTTEPRLEDPEFKFGEQKSYTVQAIGQAESPLALSVPSEALVVKPEDKFGPDAPANLAALSTGGGVQLVWEPSRDADVKSYIVYRGSDPANLQKVSEASTNSFKEGNLVAGTTYYYSVSGVDDAGNEGPRSEPVPVLVNP